jgi:ubiquinone/menaquinone biosynthesis C-methylase UbiE
MCSNRFGRSFPPSGSTCPRLTSNTQEAIYGAGRWLHLSVANAESLPVADGSQDALISIFTFHELPPKVRRAVLRECARVLKPGGRLVLVDSLQFGDQPDYDELLELFPAELP